jgi:hypothetical protein
MKYTNFIFSPFKLLKIIASNHIPYKPHLSENCDFLIFIHVADKHFFVSSTKKKHVSPTRELHFILSLLHSTITLNLGKLIYGR